MDESTLSTPIASFKLITPYSHPETSQLLNLPPELVLATIQLLSREDQQTFSLLSQPCRQLALPFLFCKLVYSHNLEKIQSLDQANGDIKAAIRELTLDESHQPVSFTESVVFQFLKSLPKLRIFRWHRPRGTPTSLNELVASLRHCPLEHFEYWKPGVPFEPVIGLSGLKSLALKLLHLASLYDLILPSFSTLVELRIRFPEASSSRKLDLLPLKPVGRTLQKFFYKAHTFDPGLLDTIPVVFPHLTTLELMFWETPRDQDTSWKKSYDDAISRNRKLEYLAVFTGGSEFCNPRLQVGVDCPGCADHRAKATHALAVTCTGLKRCTWDNKYARYRFNFNPCDSADGNTSLKVERSPSVTPRTYRQSWFGCVDLENGLRE